MDAVRSEGITTWFDLGLRLDRLRDGCVTPSLAFDDDFDAFVRHISRGVGLVTFHCSVDAVTVEVAKYAEAMRRILPEPRPHMITGRFDVRAEPIVGPRVELHVLREIDGFSNWHLYRDFFHRCMERASPLYNSLILALWDDVLVLVERLGRLTERCDIRLLYVINVNSNPGNVALALVLISEHMRIPVIANNPDLYWEGGAARQKGESPSGPRDHFFTNSHLGEVFPIIQIIYPWVERSNDPGACLPQLRFATQLVEAHQGGGVLVWRAQDRDSLSREGPERIEGITWGAGRGGAPGTISFASGGNLRVSASAVCRCAGQIADEST